MDTNRLGVVRHPDPSDARQGTLLFLREYQPDAGAPFQIDLRGADLTALNLSQRLKDMLHADFDTKTVWPPRLPAGWNPSQIMELGKNPGLGLRALHDRGITGKGVGLAVIDQVLLVDHAEYKDRLKLYEEIHVPKEFGAQMHGPAVAALAVGKTTGTAPGADLYYLAEAHGRLNHEGKIELDFTPVAQSIERVLELNRRLPAPSKIRVAAVPGGWKSDQVGFAACMEAVEKAKKAGVFVISTSLEQTHGLFFHGLGRPETKDPDLHASYELGSSWAKSFLDGSKRFPTGKYLLVPMDSRTTASPAGPNDYAFFADGGLSWSVPYLAGLYALACQVKPDVTPELFWQTALKTGRVVTVEKGAEKLELGNIVDPAALVEALTR